MSRLTTRFLFAWFDFTSAKCQVYQSLLRKQQARAVTSRLVTNHVVFVGEERRFYFLPGNVMGYVIQKWTSRIISG